MSILNVQLEEGFAPLLTFSGGTDLDITPTLGGGARVVFEGSTVLTLLDESPAALLFEGSTVLSITGPQQPADALLFEGSTSLTINPSLLVNATSRLLFQGSTQMRLSASPFVPEEFGLTLFLDILDSAIAIGSNIRRYAARVLADGVSLPVRSITEGAPRAALGVSLNVTLAKPDRTLVAALAALTFEIGVWDGDEYHWLSMMTGGKLAGREARYANANEQPADVFSFSTLDPLGDRWTLAPNAPQTFYDPDRVDAPESPGVGDSEVEESGAVIEPVNTASPGLTMREVLRLAYVEGCGFERVVTNIPDVPVASVTFTPDAGYHAAVRPLLDLFEPLYFAGDGGELWVVDADAPLPAGLSPIVLTSAEVRSLDETLPARQPVHAITVEHKADARSASDYFTERVELDTPVETGAFGSPGYTRTQTTRRVREHRRLSAPETIVREETVEEVIETTNWLFEVTSRETQRDSFDSLGRKSGHSRTFEALLPDLSGGGELLLQTAEDEKYTITYEPSARPGVDRIARTVQELSGLVLVDADKPYLGQPYELPYLDAHHSGYIDPDADQTAEFKAIRTVVETFVRGGSATAVRRQVSNHLNGPGVPERPSSQTRAGATAINRSLQGAVRRRLRAAGSEGQAGRIVPRFSAGDLPGDLAVELGRRKLARLNSPPSTVTASLPYLDFRVRRGSIVELRDRAGASLGTFIIEGYTRTLSALDSDAQQFSMSLVARQLGGAA